MSYWWEAWTRHRATVRTAPRIHNKDMNYCIFDLKPSYLSCTEWKVQIKSDLISMDSECNDKLLNAKQKRPYIQTYIAACQPNDKLFPIFIKTQKKKKKNFGTVSKISFFSLKSQKSIQWYTRHCRQQHPATYRSRAYLAHHTILPYWFTDDIMCVITLN